ncbi:rRNA maturation RNase YbeY [Colwellia sp. 39_35_sub15_T18]|nr:rRNA maturation RNase YbeY [Colwellia sp. 39_35_sub15_T18]
MVNTLDLQIVCDEKKLPSLEQFQCWTDAALQSVTSKIFELTIRLVNTDESQQLNHQYRHINKPTNVLSFPFEVPDGIDLNLLGDLIICAHVVEQEAKAQNKALFDHWAHIVIHGCLHLLGYDHINDSDAQEMEALEISILAKLAIADPY